METLVEVVIKVIGKGAESVESMAPVEVRREGFKIGVEAVKKHEQQCAKAIRIPSNRKRIEKPINKYILGWASAVRCIRVGRGKVDFATKIRAASFCPGPELGGASSLHQRGRAPECRRSACRGSRSIYRTTGQAGKDAGRVAVFLGGRPGGGTTTAASKKWRENSGAGSSSGRKTKVDRAKMGRGGGFQPRARGHGPADLSRPKTGG